MTTIKAGTTSTTAFVVDTDNSGTLVLQSGGSNDAVIFNSQTQQAAFTHAINQPGAFMFRNKIINGNFDIWQRGTSQTSSGYGSADRWTSFNTGSTKTASLQSFDLGQTEVPGNPQYFLRHVVSSVAGSGNNVLLAQRIESVRALSGGPATLSFWAKADANKNIAVEFFQRFGLTGSPSPDVSSIGSQLIALTTSWTKYTVTVDIPTVFGKSLGTDGTDFLQLGFWFDADSTYDARTASLGQQSGTFDIAQVQLEEGSVATPFEQRPIGMEFSLCQRYYYRLLTGGSIPGYMRGSTDPTKFFIFLLPVVMRTAPTCSATGLEEPSTSRTVVIEASGTTHVVVYIGASTAAAITRISNFVASAEL